MTTTQPPRWRVSAPQRRSRTHRVNGDLKSYEIHHAREVGALRTLCGEAALGWPYLWDLTFEPYADLACPQCSDRLLALTMPSPNPMSSSGSNHTPRRGPPRSE